MKLYILTCFISAERVSGRECSIQIEKYTFAGSSNPLTTMTFSSAHKLNKIEQRLGRQINISDCEYVTINHPHFYI